MTNPSIYAAFQRLWVHVVNFISTRISTHDSSSMAHSDIRDSITELENQVNQLPSADELIILDCGGVAELTEYEYI